VWGVNRDGAIYRGTGDGNWQRVEGNLRHVSCDKFGDIVWGTNASDHVFTWAGGNWKQVDGALRQLTVSADGVWVYGTNADGNIFRRHANLSSGWQRVEGRVHYISTFDGTFLAGVTDAGKIYFATTGVNSQM